MKINRRKFIALSVSTVPAIGVLAHPEKLKSGEKKLVAAVLESSDTKTLKMTGAELLLKRAGFEVIRLTPEEMIKKDISVSDMVMNFEDPEQTRDVVERMKNPRYTFPVGPDHSRIDLLFFGTFTNGFQPYHDYMRRYAQQIPDFVKQGGVVMEMSQWGRYTFLYPNYLPSGMKVVRETWSGTDELIAVNTDHPFVKRWIDGDIKKLHFPKQPHRPEVIYDGRRSWESIAEWEGMNLLIGAGGGYKKGAITPGRAALLEGQHGSGRYLISSLWLDKIFDAGGAPAAEEGTVKAADAFFRSLYQYVADIKARRLNDVKPTSMPAEPLIGPALGHVDHQQAIIWMRGNRNGTYRVAVRSQNGKTTKTLAAQASDENDYCVKFHLTGLEPNTVYTYAVSGPDGAVLSGRDLQFKTAPTPGQPAVTTLAFGSCVDMNGRFGELWKQIWKHGADGMVLLGDTPYVDSTQITQQRIKHRYFLAQEGPAFLSKKIPFWGTWDDHDFGANDSDGGLHNRNTTRKVFKEYRALLNYGENEQGIYTNFRRGPVEVFILDTRYFARTEPSFAAPDKPTLIGKQQWEWLQRVLKASTAPFKILTCGMTWDKKLPETPTHADTWDSFSYEREAVIDFIGQEKISGVMLVGGDIHCTQVMKYSTEKRIGYPLYHIVTSPMHERLIRGNEALDHPGILFNKAVANTFLKITVNTKVEPSILSADIVDITGASLYRLVIGGE